MAGGAGYEVMDSVSEDFFRDRTTKRVKHTRADDQDQTINDEGTSSLRCPVGELSERQDPQLNESDDHDIAPDNLDPPPPHPQQHTSPTTSPQPDLRPVSPQTCQSLVLGDILTKVTLLPPSELNEDNEICQICYQPYLTAADPRVPPEVPMKLPCGHVLGSGCIFKWISALSDDVRNSCPMCQEPILDEGLFEWGDTPMALSEYFSPEIDMLGLVADDGEDDVVDIVDDDFEDSDSVS